jgi:hypothetical protein
VSENRALRRIFGHKKNGVRREGRKLHKGSLSIRTPHPISFGVTKSRIRWAGHIARMGQKRDTCRVLVGKAEGKRPRHNNLRGTLRVSRTRAGSPQAASRRPCCAVAFRRTAWQV